MRWHPDKRSGNNKERAATTISFGIYGDVVVLWGFNGDYHDPLGESVANQYDRMAEAFERCLSKCRLFNLSWHGLK